MRASQAISAKDLYKEKSSRLGLRWDGDDGVLLPVRVAAPAGFPGLVELEPVGEGEALALPPPVVQPPPGVAVGADYDLAARALGGHGHPQPLVRPHLVIAGAAAGPRHDPSDGGAVSPGLGQLALPDTPRSRITWREFVSTISGIISPLEISISWVDCGGNVSRLTSPYEMAWPVVLVCDGVDWVKTHNKFKCWLVLQFISPLCPHNIPGHRSFHRGDVIQDNTVHGSPLSAGLAAVVPGCPHQSDAVEGVPVHYLVLGHAVAEVRAGWARLDYRYPRLQIKT